MTKVGSIYASGLRPSERQQWTLVRLLVRRSSESEDGSPKGRRLDLSRRSSKSEDGCSERDSPTTLTFAIAKDSLRRLPFAEKGSAFLAFFCLVLPLGRTRHRYASSLTAGKMHKGDEPCRPVPFMHVLGERLELSLVSQYGPEPYASTNSAIRAVKEVLDSPREIFIPQSTKTS